jgi:hypothetical protein
VAALKKSDQLKTIDVVGFNGFFLAMAHWRLGENEEARKCYDRAVTATERNGGKDPRLKRFQAEAMEVMGLADKQD